MSGSDYYKVYTSISSPIDLITEGNNLPVLAVTCLGAGNLVTKTQSGVSVTIPVSAGQTLRIEPRSIEASTTALPLIVFWGYGEGGVFAGESGSGGGGGGGDASAANQTTQIALENDIKDYVQLGSGWFPYRFSLPIAVGDIGSGFDISAITPVGQKVIGIAASRSSLNGQVIYLEAEGNDPGDFVELDFGRGYIHYGQWKTIGSSSTAGCFPVRIMFAAK